MVLSNNLKKSQINNTHLSKETNKNSQQAFIKINIEFSNLKNNKNNNCFDINNTKYVKITSLKTDFFFISF